MRYLRSLSFIQGTSVNALRTSILFLMLYLIFTQRDHRRAVLLAVDLLVLHLRAAAGAGERHQHLPRDRGLAEELPGHPGHARASRGPTQPVAVEPLSSARLRGRARSRTRPASRARAARTSPSRVRGARRSPSWGRPGSGKTTLVKLLVGPLPPAGGPHPLQRPSRDTEVDLDALRERIGFVTQDTQLFSGTIRENLLFVRPDATDAECLEVLHKAACDSLLARARQGPRHA